MSTLAEQNLYFSVFLGAVENSYSVLLGMKKVIGANPDYFLIAEYIIYPYSGPLQNSTVIWFTYIIGNDDPAITQGDTVYIGNIPNITIAENSSISSDVKVTGIKAGHLDLGVNSSSQELKK